MSCRESYKKRLVEVKNHQLRSNVKVHLENQKEGISQSQSRVSVIRGDGVRNGVNDSRVYKVQGQSSFIPIGIKKEHLQEIQEIQKSNDHDSHFNNIEVNNNQDEWGKYVEYQRMIDDRRWSKLGKQKSAITQQLLKQYREQQDIKKEQVDEEMEIGRENQRYLRWNGEREHEEKEKQKREWENEKWERRMEQQKEMRQRRQSKRREKQRKVIEDMIFRDQGGIQGEILRKKSIENISNINSNVHSNMNSVDDCHDIDLEYNRSVKMEQMKRQRKVDIINKQMVDEKINSKNDKADKQKEAEQFFERNDGLLKRELGLIEQKIQSHHDQMEQYRQRGLQNGITNVMEGRIEKYDCKQDRYSEKQGLKRQRNEEKGQRDKQMHYGGMREQIEHNRSIRQKEAEHNTRYKEQQRQRFMQINDDIQREKQQEYELKKQRQYEYNQQLNQQRIDQQEQRLKEKGKMAVNEQGMNGGILRMITDIQNKQKEHRISNIF